jgi:choline dehydrogenase-like flavoprotein
MGTGHRIHQGLYAIEFREHPNWVEVTALDLASDRLLSVRARRLFLGMGAINSTRMVARSLGLVRRPIRLKDSQYFFFPLLSYSKASSDPAFTLAELFIEILNPVLGPYYTHFQVYGLNPLFRQTIHALVPWPLRRPSLLRELEERFYLFQGFLHSEQSGGLELSIESIEGGKERVKIRGLSNPDSLRVARRAQRLLRRELLGFGLIPPVYLTMVPLGRSFHVGGSFPMGGHDPILRSDRLGRPAGLKRVHLLDAATFPSIPATTITLPIMANADRVIHETMGG